jgi:two-component system response regulator BaeR
MRGKILVVEDEPRLAALLRDYLHKEGYEAHCLKDGLEVAPWVREQAPDLILLTHCRAGTAWRSARRSFLAGVPIMVTARVRRSTACSAWGADDYICKPFGLKGVARQCGSASRKREVIPRDSRASAR